MKFLSLLAIAAAVAVLGVNGAARAEPAGQSDDQVKAALTDLETKSWDAWKARDGKYFADFTSDDHLDVQTYGMIGKADVVSGVSSPACVVASYSLGPIHYQRISPDTAVLVYEATQDTTCNGHKLPTPSWVTSVYVNRNGRWLNFLFGDVAAQK